LRKHDSRLTKSGKNQNFHIIFKGTIEKETIGTSKLSLLAEIGYHARAKVTRYPPIGQFFSNKRVPVTEGMRPVASESSCATDHECHQLQDCSISALIPWTHWKRIYYALETLKGLWGGVLYGPAYVNVHQMLYIYHISLVAVL
jgi:hypothetical protein